MVVTWMAVVSHLLAHECEEDGEDDVANEGEKANDELGDPLHPPGGEVTGLDLPEYPEAPSGLPDPPAAAPIPENINFIILLTMPSDI